MIKLQDYTPSVYYNKSRDFQFIGRLYDLILNYARTNIDLINGIPFSDNIDTKLLDLLALNLGFKPRHDYNIDQLRVLCSAFCEILKNKGNFQSIIMAGNALLSAEGIREEFSCELVDSVLKVWVPESLSDMSLFVDLLDYILPAGISVELYRATRQTKAYGSTVTVEDDVEIFQPDNKYDSLFGDFLTDNEFPELPRGENGENAFEFTDGSVLKQ